RRASPGATPRAGRARREHGCLVLPRPGSGFQRELVGGGGESGLARPSVQAIEVATVQDPLPLGLVQGDTAGFQNREERKGNTPAPHLAGLLRHDALVLLRDHLEGDLLEVARTGGRVHTLFEDTGLGSEVRLYIVTGEQVRRRGIA